ncbi:hypothetical protein [Halobacterium sp. KA-6]|uniref:hypothetical protein n=1 Tax=Halobacterium sp. KA-6 TaxID=2896368 RepID=UPI001E643857|nr:hypothetical protein [Halobacterium sp. KA-6]MCD2204885.1 hypothetical protein [Halobacterium sp. KA-6]
MSSIQLTAQELSAILVIGVVLGVSRYFRYDVEGGFPVIDVLLSTVLAFLVATAALLVAKRLGVVPES